jgi:hypothetical protein
METQYGEAVARREHDYGEYIEQIDFIERAREHLPDSDIVEGIASLFLNTYGDELPNRNTRRKAYDKAKSLVRRRGKGERNILPGFTAKEGLRRAIKESIERGHLKNVKLEVPWHPLVFRDQNKLTTFPHHHKYAVLWTGRNKYEFETEEYIRRNSRHEDVADGISAEELFNLRSSLKKGFINPGNQHDPDDGNNHLAKIEGVYLTWDLKKANAYGNERGVGCVLECELPTNYLIFTADKINSLEEWYEVWSNPFNLLRQIGSEVNNEVVYTKAWNGGDRPIPYLPLTFVNGVKDPELAQSEHFFPLKEWAVKMSEMHPEKYPDPSEFNLVKPSKKELKYSFERAYKSQKEYEKAQKFEEELEAFIKFQDSFRKAANSLERIGINQQTVQTYNDKLETLYEECEKLNKEYENNRNTPDRKPVKAQNLNKNYLDNIVKESEKIEKNVKKERDYIYELMEKGKEKQAEKNIQETIKYINKGLGDFRFLKA